MPDVLVEVLDEGGLVVEATVQTTLVEAQVQRPVLVEVGVPSAFGGSGDASSAEMGTTLGTTRIDSDGSLHLEYTTHWGVRDDGGAYYGTPVPGDEAILKVNDNGSLSLVKIDPLAVAPALVFVGGDRPPNTGRPWVWFRNTSSGIVIVTSNGRPPLYPGADVYPSETLFPGGAA